ncbi:hypothetical protein ASPWEDRAFT_22552 [Aspergillus wentii DTO 134E9]|uniref:Uncharacterized protein n=1 Tax=Aspergillus wentii DTO 134E9 TaxID=1073089 RepID=A0A1L9RZM8_ASPWE|nr:uncharacterized protein ASPWEDRAFT_22552 [Aspergillus wentii DTO 134E9]KAI9932786.1 hypothetical protein MW887_009038 [Aspergillus wentii]OJJ40365.1 hypothetical protein ASPWEDRAFT_22552 [Aspergillus wentii DTO 134E9]
MSKQAVQNRITHILTHWPKDLVRPASVSVQSYLHARLAAEDPTKQPQQPQQQQQPAQNVHISESSLKALSSLLEDRYARRYPLTPKLRRPASNPDHYDNVVREFEEAPNRDWFGRLGKRVKGIFRMT